MIYYIFLFAASLGVMQPEIISFFIDNAFLFDYNISKRYIGANGMSEKKTQYVILGLLNESNLSGYEIKKIIDMRFSFFWNESYGQIFPQLKLLTEKQLIRVVNGNKSKRDKLTYAITDKGKDELRKWLHEPVEKESVRFEILLKMYFSNLVEKDVIKKHIEEFKNRHEQKLEILNLFYEELKEIVHLHPNHEDILRVIDFGQKVYNAYINWCNETISYLGRERGNQNEAKN